MPNTPYLALTLELLHVSLRTWTGLALAADADGRTTFCRPAAREKAAGSSAQLRMWMLRKDRTRLGVLGPLGALERSICACVLGVGLVSVLCMCQLMTMTVSDNDS